MAAGDDLMECAHALIRRHGTDAAAVAERFADVHIASDAEVADFWNAVAQEVRRMLSSLSDFPARKS